MIVDYDPLAALTADQLDALAEASVPLWREMERHGWVDSPGGMEYKRVFPVALRAIHSLANDIEGEQRGTA